MVGFMRNDTSTDDGHLAGKSIDSVKKSPSQIQ